MTTDRTSPFYDWSAEKHLAFWLKQRFPLVRQFVYVIQGDPGGPIKVGKAMDPKHRRGELQTGNPEHLRLLLVAPGWSKLETQLHRKLRGNESPGGSEWFEGPAVPGFLEWMERYTESVVQDFIESGEIQTELAAEIKPKLKPTPGLRPVRGWGKTKLQQAWRTRDETVSPVVTRFVTPAPKMDPAEAQAIRRDRAALRNGTYRPPSHS